VRVSYLDELVKKVQEETGATFVIITHNIASVMRTSDHIAVLYQARLVKFAAKAEMRTTDDPIIRQFLTGRANGPIGMDELATEESAIERDLAERELARQQGEGEADPSEILTV
jgi:phospholipid/cholesterol/gamma-HCH transport system ATP-binding protein